MRSLIRFWTDERGEMAPASYLIMVPMAMAFIFFTIDLGIRKGIQLGVEYAAFCAARAAAASRPVHMLPALTASNCLLEPSQPLPFITRRPGLSPAQAKADRQACSRRR